MKKLILFIFFFIFMSPFTLSANDFDGSKSLLCSIETVIHCDQGKDCQKGTASEFSLPQFLRINFKKKTIKGINKKGAELVAEITTMNAEYDNLILQGHENGRAWGMVISQSTGEMTATVTREESGYIIFGACIVP